MGKIELLKPNTHQLNVLESKLKLLAFTDDGKAWIENRYSSYIEPQEIIESIKYKNSLIAISENNILGYGELSPTKDNYLEIGYFVFPEYAGNGIGYNLAQKLMEIGMQLEGYKGIKIEAEITNVASQTIMEKLAEKFKPVQITANENFDPPTRIFFWNK